MEKEIEKTILASEVLEEELLDFQHQLKSLDEQYSSNIEAIQALKVTKDSKVWLCTSDMFIAVPVNSAKTILDNQQAIIQKSSTEQQDNIKQTT